MKHYVRSFLLVIALALLLFNARSGSYVSAHQRQQAQPACPVIAITCPEMIYIKEKLQITADVRGGDSRVTPTFNWTVPIDNCSFGGTTVFVRSNGVKPLNSTRRV